MELKTVPLASEKQISPKSFFDGFSAGNELFLMPSVRDVILITCLNGETGCRIWLSFLQIGLL